MSQPSNAVLNGPSPENNVPFKDAQATQETTKTQQNGNGSNQPFPGYVTGAPRPPLTRLDSRSSLPLRPNFPNQPGVVIRPQQVRQPSPGQQQFIQRPPGPATRPSGQPQFTQNQGARPNINPNFRPSTPFPRPQAPQGQGPRQPGIFQQRPIVGQQKSQFESEQIIKSQTLDSPDSNINKSPDYVKTGQDDSGRSSVNTNKNRSFSPNVGESQDDERRRSISSVGSVDEKKSISGSMENLDKKSENEYPSRPESRASSRMNKIMEDDIDDKFSISNKPSSPQTDVTQKSVDFTLPTSETKSKSPVEEVKSKTPVEELKRKSPMEEIKSKSPSPINKIKDNKINKTEIKEETVKIKQKEEKDTKNIQNGHIEKPKDKKIETKIKPERKPKHESKTLELKNLTKAKSPSRSEGDNDSGVDESTQGNDQSSNGDHSSPRKSSGKAPSRTSSTTPTKNRSLSRGSKSPSLKSPDSTASTPGTTEKKKVPMNKIQVGSAPSPNLKVVRSKIGSLENASYKPGGGNVKIESKKVDFKNASARIEAKNEKYTPKGGDKKIQQQKLQWNAKSKIGSLENTSHKPKGGDKKIETIKLDFKEKAKPKVGSKDNLKHVPGGGEVKFDEVEEEIKEEIENKKLDLKVQSKVGSLDNVKHRPGGGDKKIFDDKEYLKQRSVLSSENHSLSGSQKKFSKTHEVSFEKTVELIEEKPSTFETAEEIPETSRPSSRLSRSGSGRIKKSPTTPRPPWRF